MPDIHAHITGTVLSVHCGIGDRVGVGDTVVMLESMKMEMPVEAQNAGTVCQIWCAEGQSVREGDRLLQIE